MPTPIMQPTMASHFDREALLDCAAGNMFGVGNAQLPFPPMLMIDKITLISEQGGDYNQGEIIAEMAVTPDLWFFKCHFINDPVMPGCLGLDALWQLLGFYLGWKGHLGQGRALGLGDLKFSGQVLPTNKVIRYHVSIKRVFAKKLILGIADAKIYVDDTLIYTAKDLRCGLFIPAPKLE